MLVEATANPLPSLSLVLDLYVRSHIINLIPQAANKALLMPLYLVGVWRQG